MDDLGIAFDTPRRFVSSREAGGYVIVLQSGRRSVSLGLPELVIGGR